MIKTVTAAGAAAVALPLLLILLVTASPAPPAATAALTGLDGAATGIAIAGIPPQYLMWYMDAAQTCPGLPWAVLAGIGKVESDHGRSPLPGVHSGANSAGAEGPMQFEPATFSAYATGPDRPLSPYDPADAIYSAAAALCAQGARGGSLPGIEKAVFAYNHAEWYVTEVMSWAVRYTAGQPAGTAAPTATALTSAFAMQQAGGPFRLDAAGPDSCGCSGPARAGAGPRPARAVFRRRQDGPVVPPSQTQPGDLLYSAGGGNRSDPGHAAMYLGGGQASEAPRGRPGRRRRPRPPGRLGVTPSPESPAIPAQEDFS